MDPLTDELLSYTLGFLSLVDLVATERVSTSIRTKIQQILLRVKTLKLTTAAPSSWFDGGGKTLAVLSHLKNLQEIDFASSPEKCTDSVLRLLSQQCKKLQSLLMRGAGSSCTDAGIASLRDGLEHLKLIDLSIGQRNGIDTTQTCLDLKH